MDCAWLDHPIQDCESSQPNHTLAHRRNSLTRMVTLQWTCDYICEQCAKHPLHTARRVRGWCVPHYRYASLPFLKKKSLLVRKVLNQREK